MQQAMKISKGKQVAGSTSKSNQKKRQRLTEFRKKRYSGHISRQFFHLQACLKPWYRFWYTAQNFQPTFSTSVFSRSLFKIAIFARSLKMAIATSIFMNERYDDGFAPEFSISVLKRIMALVPSYICETKEIKSNMKLGQKKQNQWKIYVKLKYEIFFKADIKKVG